jgi:hypothetical protein
MGGVALAVFSGKRSFIRRERVTFRRAAAEGAHSSGDESSGLINDLEHVVPVV